jgi:hypothetical protein
MESPAGPSEDPASPDGPAGPAGPSPARRLLLLLRLRRRRSKQARPMTARRAGVILAGLALIAIALGVATAGLAIRGLAAAGAGGTVSPTLIMPAPERAAGLPRHYRLTTDQSALLAIAQFRQRFAVIRGGSAATYPQALYGEPGRIDLASGSAGWVMYLGYDAQASLGGPAATTARLMADLAGTASARSWQVPAGIQDENARCMIAVIGLMRMSVCGWATERTIAAFMSPTRDTSVTELAALMLAMRPDLRPG